MSILPFKLIETDGELSLTLSEFSLTEQMFDDIGHSGGGYGWECVVKQIVEEVSSLRDRLDFDSEAGMFCAVSSDQSALEELGQILSSLINDKDVGEVGMSTDQIPPVLFITSRSLKDGLRSFIITSELSNTDSNHDEPGFAFRSEVMNAETD